MGKYPSKGWNKTTGGGSKDYFEDTVNLVQPNGYWNGAEAVLRISAFWFNVRKVTGNSGSHGRLFLTPNTTYSTATNYGYFLQNHINCLSNNGDWSFDGTYLYLFSSSDPDLLSIQAAVYQNGITCNGNTVKIENLNFTAFNGCGIETGVSSTNIFIRNCSFSHCVEGISSTGNRVINIIYNEFTNIGNTAINIKSSYNVCIIENFFNDIGIYAGFGSNGLNAVQLENCDSAKIYTNDLNGIGYSGIHVALSSRIYVERNRIKEYCLLTDDGAGIYFWTSNRSQIKSNFTSGGDGSECIASANTRRYISNGIYTDYNCNYIKIINNLSVNNSINILVNPGSHIHIVNNITCKSIPSNYPSAELWMDSRPGSLSVKFCTVAFNMLVASWSDKGTHHACYALVAMNIDSTNKFHNNYYMLINGQYNPGSKLIMSESNIYDVSSWIGAGRGSNEYGDTLLSETGTNKKNTIDYQYNFSGQMVNYPFEDGYVYYDIAGNKLEQYTLQPYSGMVLLKYISK